MSEEKNISKSLAVAGAVATLSVPVLYIFGYAYDQGYLRGYGVSNEFFARSPQEYLVLAFLACLGIATSILEFSTKNQWIFLLLASLFWLFGLIAIGASKFDVGGKLRAGSASVRQHRHFDYIFFPLVSAILGAAMPLLAIVAISFILVIPGIFYLKGKDVAQKEIGRAKRCNSAMPTDECVSLIENGKPVAAGRVVARSASHLALFNDGRVVIFPVKDQTVEVVTISALPNKSVERGRPQSGAPSTQAR